MQKITINNKYFFLLLIIFILLFPNLTFSVDWDIYFGIKGGLGFGGSINEVDLHHIYPAIPENSTSPDKRGRLVGLAGFSANFISPKNFGIETELMYRLGGERIHDNNEAQHSLRLHYVDIAILGKYWFFGKLISAGLGVAFSFLGKAVIHDGEDITDNFNKFDILAILKISFNHWEVSKKIILSLELSCYAGLINTLKNSGQMNNIGIFISFGFFYIGKTTGVQLREYRY